MDRLLGLVLRIKEGVHLITLFYSNVLEDKEKKTKTKNKALSQDKLYLDGLVGSCDEGNEQRQHHVYEEGDEGVQVDLAEQPHHRAGLLHLGERHKHVVAVNEGEEAL